MSEGATVREIRLSSILKKWQDAAPLSFFKSLPKQDLLDAGIPREELEKNGLIIAETPTAKAVPKQCGMREMARVLTDAFGIEVFPEQLRRAVKDNGMHGWIKSCSKFNTAQAIQWWKENKAKTSDQVAEGAAAKARREIILTRTAELDLAEKERALDAKWALKADAQMSVTAAVLQYHALAKKTIDRDFAKLVLERLGELDETTKQKIQSAVTDAARDCVRAIEEYAEKL